MGTAEWSRLYVVDLCDHHVDTTMALSHDRPLIRSLVSSITITASMICDRLYADITSKFRKHVLS